MRKTTLQKKSDGLLIERLKTVAIEDISISTDNIINCFGENIGKISGQNILIYGKKGKYFYFKKIITSISTDNIKLQICNLLKLKSSMARKTKR